MIFNEHDLQQFIGMLASPRSEAGTGRFAELHARIKQRESHFFNLEAADQKLPPPHEDVEPFQSDVLRQTWVQGKARLAENPFRIRAVAPKTTPKSQQIADRFEKAMNRGMELMQERGNVSFQGDLADGQFIYCYGVLHWQKANDLWPKMPDPEVYDEDPGDAKRYRKGDDDRYHETDESLQERDREAKAACGFPFFAEVLHPGTVSFVVDRSMENGLGMVMVLRETPLLEYQENLARQDKRWLRITSLNDQREAIRIYTETDRPADDEPSANVMAWGKQLYVAQIWTRDEFYELVSTNKGAAGFTLVKSFEHHYGMPPFAIARALHVNHPDPALAYMPAMEGLYRVKPFFDHDMTLGRAIAEQIALPFYYIKLSDGSYMSDQEGKRLVFSRNALAAEALPPGAEVVALSPELNTAVIEFLKFAAEEMGKAAPETGNIEVGASTQPWTIRLAQDQANAQIKNLKGEQASAIRIMVRNMQHLMTLPADKGGFGQPIPVSMASGDILEIDPEEIRGLTVQVDINPVSSAQRIANIEHGRQLLADPNVPYSRRMFLEQDLEVEDVEGTIEEWKAEAWFDMHVEPGFLRQKVAERFGGAFVVGPDGLPVNSDGQTVTPMDVLKQRGYQVKEPQRMGAPGGPAMPMDGGMQRSVRAESMPVPQALPPIAAPGTSPLPGMPS